MNISEMKSKNMIHYHWQHRPAKLNKTSYTVIQNETIIFTTHNNKIFVATVIWFMNLNIFNQTDQVTLLLPRPS